MALQDLPIEELEKKFADSEEEGDEAAMNVGSSEKPAAATPEAGDVVPDKGYVSTDYGYSSDDDLDIEAELDWVDEIEGAPQKVVCLSTVLSCVMLGNNTTGSQLMIEAFLSSSSSYGRCMDRHRLILVHLPTLLWPCTGLDLSEGVGAATTAGVPKQFRPNAQSGQASSTMQPRTSQMQVPYHTLP